MTNKGQAFLEQGVKRIFPQFRTENNWDGLWRMFIYSIPQKQSKLRSVVRKELMWLGFGSLAYGVWVSPNPMEKDVEDLIREHKLTNYTEVFLAKGRDLSEGRKMVEKCWNLDKVNQLYIEFIAKYQEKLQENGDDIQGNLSFRNRVELSYDYRKLIFADPALPKVLQPDNWMGEEAGKLFEMCFQKWKKSADAYFDSILVTKSGSMKRVTPKGRDLQKAGSSKPCAI